MPRRAHICVAVVMTAVACGGRSSGAAGASAMARAAALPLDSTDFVVDRLNDGMDSSAVRRAMGAPDSIVVEKHPYDTDATLATWFYPAVTVGFNSSADAYQLTIESPNVATARGLRVGDPGARAQALYGFPADTVDGTWDYHDPRDPSGLHVLRIRVASGRVTSVFVGTLLD
jgi:hypothetical protein